MKSKRHDGENQLPEVSGEVSVREDRKRLVVSVRHVATPDAGGRVRRGIEILLRAAARDTSQAKESRNTKSEEPPRSAPV